MCKINEFMSLLLKNAWPLALLNTADLPDTCICVYTYILTVYYRAIACFITILRFYGFWSVFVGFFH